MESPYELRGACPYAKLWCTNGRNIANDFLIFETTEHKGKSEAADNNCALCDMV